jgi:uncharacterized protein
MSSPATPISAQERIYTLDVIRGFALLGIFIMNMPTFNVSLFANVLNPQQFPGRLDQWVATGGEVLFSGKFNSMFSMLFAVGFTIQLERLAARAPAHATAIYLRRIFWLFLFGVIHACVFWTGDVLHIYALFGLVLLALRRAPDKVLWTLFGLCLLYPAGMGIYRLLTFDPAERAAWMVVIKAWDATNNAAYGHGSFLAAAREHTREMMFYFTDPRMLLIMTRFYVAIFSTMILGLLLGRHHVFQNSARYLPQVRRVQWWTLALGVVTGVVFGIWEATVTDTLTPTPFRVIASICYILCRVSIMAFYVATIVRAVHHEGWRRRLAPMATAGRMPLTNYLLQTLIATFVFYGWGLGFWGRVGPALDMVLAFAIFFAIQVPLSKWWLARFELGPMEYLWRRLSYGRAGVVRPMPAAAR